MPTLIGPRFFRRDQIMKARERLDNLWREHIDPEGDRVLARLVRRFDDPTLPEPTDKPRGYLPGVKGVGRIAKLILAMASRWENPSPICRRTRSISISAITGSHFRVPSAGGTSGRISAPSSWCMIRSRSNIRSL